MLGIIGAMDEEVAKIKEEMTQVQVTRTAGMDFYVGKLCGQDAVVVRSGIGKVNAGMCTQILADRFQADAVINTGIAGSLKNEIYRHSAARRGCFWLRLSEGTDSEGGYLCI